MRKVIKSIVCFTIIAALIVSSFPAHADARTVTKPGWDLNAPYGLAFHDGKLYVADTMNNRVQVFGTDEGLVMTLGDEGGDSGTDNSHLGSPRSVAVDSSTEHIYVLDSGNNRIQEFDNQGDWIKTFALPRYTLEGMAYDDNGYIFYTDQNNTSVERLDVNTGAIKEVFRNFYDRPMGVAVDSEGNVYISQYFDHIVLVYEHLSDDSYAYKRTIGEPKVAGTDNSLLNNPIGLYIDRQDRLYIADQGNKRVQVYNQDGSYAMTLAHPGFDSPRHTTSDNDGNLYVVDNGTRKIYMFDEHGDFVRILGQNTIPTFTASDSILNVDQNSEAADIKHLLHVSDIDPNQTLTWTLTEPPAHGTVNMSGTSALSGGTDIAPGGTANYTPMEGFYGTDHFKVQVNDGNGGTESRTITVYVIPRIYAIGPIPDISLPELQQGDGGKESEPIHIANAGTMQLTNLTVSINGKHADAFAITPPVASTLDLGESTTFAIQSKDGLKAGTYSVDVTVSAEHMTDVTFIATQVVNLPDAPLNPLNLTAEASDRAVELSWGTVTGATYYNVYKSEYSGLYDGTAFATVTAATYDVHNLTNGTTYYFVIKAGNDGGLSGESNEASATPATVPFAPENVTASAGNGQATITFTAPAYNGGSPIARYDVYDADGFLVGTGDSSPIIVTGLMNGASYTFTVKAVNSVGSSTSSAATNPVTPSIPENDSGDDSGNDSGVDSGDDNSRSRSKTASPQAPATGVDVIVNGKSERLGTVITAKVDGRDKSIVTLNEEKLQELLESESEGAMITISVPAGSDIATTEWNGNMVKNLKAKKAIIHIQTEAAAYSLPAELIDIDSLADTLGARHDMQSMKFMIEIETPTDHTVQIVEDAANEAGFISVGHSVTFKASAVYHGQFQEMPKLRAYNERTMLIPNGIDTNRITTAVVVEPDGTVRHVPTQIIEIDGVQYAKINSLTNGTYSLVWNPIEFADTENHWAEDAIHNMGSRMVVYGIADGKFDPDRDITRAEFTAILVRALGLNGDQRMNVFTDVVERDWYHGAIHSAYEYELIEGYTDGDFGPDEVITREQAMVILSRAMNISGLSNQLSHLPSGDVLRSYQDVSDISPWAMEGIVNSVQAELVIGRSETELMPKALMTRAEVAVMVERLLQASSLI